MVAVKGQDLRLDCMEGVRLPVLIRRARDVVLAATCDAPVPRCPAGQCAVITRDTQPALPSLQAARRRRRGVDR
jgi:hypothetical protein